jgi:small subunit ribosomal protein S18
MDRRPGRGRFEKKKRSQFGPRRKKICRFCENRITYIDFKDERILRRFITERGKIVPRRISGNCAKHQRKLTQAIKRSRHMAIMPFASESYR